MKPIFVEIPNPDNWSYNGKTLEDMLHACNDKDVSLQELVQINRDMISLTSVMINNVYILSMFGALCVRLKAAGYIRDYN